MNYWLLIRLHCLDCDRILFIMFIQCHMRHTWQKKTLSSICALNWHICHVICIRRIHCWDVPHHHHIPVIRSAGRRGVKVDAAPHRVLHWSLLSATRSKVETFRPVHSLMLSIQVFLCPHLCREPLTVPCKIVFDKESCRVTCPYQASLRRFTYW
jgi:hypothetical protein